MLLQVPPKRRRCVAGYAMPSFLDCYPRRDSGAGEEIENDRARIRQRSHEAPNDRAGLLRGMADALARVAVEPADAPNIGGILPLGDRFGPKALVAQVGGLGRIVERFADG